MFTAIRLASSRVRLIARQAHLYCRRGDLLDAALLHCMSRKVALDDRLPFSGRPSLTGHCGHGWTCSLPRPVAIDLAAVGGRTVSLERAPRRAARFVTGSRRDSAWRGV
jgi:hypothetical protein